MTGDAIDLDRLIDEIDDEVRRRRAEGELDPEWERGLDALFVTGGSSEVADYARLLDEAEHLAHIDATPPSESQLVGGQAIKRALGRTMSWYVGNVVRQVTALAVDLVGAARLLGERVASLERTIDATGDERSTSLLEPHLDVTPWTSTVLEALRPVTGRVLHGEAGDGTVVRMLLDGGVDAYGVEPRLVQAERAAVHGLDVREQGLTEHLGSLPPRALGGLLLSGCVDTLANEPRQRLIRSARRAVAPGGVLVLIASDPQRWSDAAPLVADLAPGRPWHAATWSRVLADCGFDPGAPARDEVAGTVAIVAVRRPA